MVSSNNRYLLEKKINNQKPIYGLRKLSMGFGSVLLGTLLYASSASADAVDTSSTIANQTANVETSTTAGNTYSEGSSQTTHTSLNDNSQSSVNANASSLLNSTAQTIANQNILNTTNSVVSNTGDTPSVTATDYLIDTNTANSQVDSNDNQGANTSSKTNSIANSFEDSVTSQDNNSSYTTYTLPTNTANYQMPSAVQSSLVETPQAQVNLNNFNITKDDTNAGTYNLSLKDQNYSGDLVLPNVNDIKGQYSDATKLVLNKDNNWNDSHFNDVTSLTVSNNGDGKLVANGAWQNAFSGFTKTTKMDLKGLDVSGVTDMSGLFSNLTNLQSVDLTGWNTKNVANLKDMFANDDELADVRGLNDLDLTSAVDLSGMFGGDSKLTSFDFSNVKTSPSLVNMAGMFRGVGAQDIDLSNFDTQNVTNMGSLFMQATNLNQVTGLSADKTAKVTNMSNMFAGTALTNFDLNNLSGAGAQDLSGMFSSMPALTSLDHLAQFGQRNLNNDVNQVTNLSNFVNGDSALANLDLSGFTNTANLTDLSGAFSGIGVTNLDVSMLNTSNVESMADMLSNNQKLISVKLGKLDARNVENMSAFLADDPKLVNIDLSGMQTSSKLTDLSSMFMHDSSVTTLTGLNNLNTSNVYSFNSMFSGLKNLKTLDGLSSFDTGKATDMGSMFSGMSALNNLNLSNFNTSNVTDMSDMFNGASSLNNLDLSNFNTQKAKTFADLFSSMDSLSGLNLSNWNFNSLDNSNGYADRFFGDKNTTTTSVTPKELILTLNNGVNLTSDVMNNLVHPRGDVMEVIYSNVNGLQNPSTNGVDSKTNQNYEKVLHTIHFASIANDNNKPQDIVMPILYQNEDDLRQQLNAKLKAALGDKYVVNKSYVNVDHGTDASGAVNYQQSAIKTGPEMLNGNYVVAQKSTKVIKFVDDDYKDGMKNIQTNAPLKQDVLDVTVNGATLQKVKVGAGTDYSQVAVPNGYVLAAGQTLPTEVDFSNPNDTTPIEVHLHHKLVDNNEDKDFVRNIIGKKSDGTTTTETQKVTLRHHTVIDEATHQVVTDEWNTGEFPEFKPNVDGWKNDTGTIPSARVTKDTPAESEVDYNLTPAAPQVNIYIQYMDLDDAKSDGSPREAMADLSTKLSHALKGTVDGNSDYMIPLPIIQADVQGNGFELDKTQNKLNVNGSLKAFKLDGDTNQTLTIYLRHQKETTEEKATVKRNVYVKSPVDGKEKLVTTQISDTTRDKIHDLKLNKTSYSNWSTINFDNVDLSKYGLDHYVLDKPQVNGISLNNDQIKALKFDNNVATLPDVVVGYTANKVTLNTKFVDADSNNSVVSGGQSVTQNYGNKITYRDLASDIPQGYEIDPSVKLDDQVTFDTNRDVTIPLRHQKQDVTNNPTYYNQTHESVSRTIVFVGTQDNDTHAIANEIDQTARFKRTAMLDLVSGDVVFGNWTYDKETSTNKNAPQLDAVKLPNVYGWKVVDGSKVDQVVLDPNKLPADSTVTVSYTPIMNSMTIHYIDEDDNNKELFTDQVTGRIGEMVNIPDHHLNDKYEIDNKSDKIATGSVSLDETMTGEKHVYLKHRVETQNYTKTVQYQVIKVSGDGNKVLVSKDIDLPFTKTTDLATNDTIDKFAGSSFTIDLPAVKLDAKTGYVPTIISIDGSLKTDEQIKQLAQDLSNKSSLSLAQAQVILQQVYQQNTAASAGAKAAHDADVLNGKATVALNQFVAGNGMTVYVFDQAKPVTLHFTLVDDDDPNNKEVANGFGQDDLTVGYTGKLINLASVVKDSGYQTKLDAWLKAHPGYDLVTKDANSVPATFISTDGQGTTFTVHLKHHITTNVENKNASEKIAYVDGHGAGIPGGRELAIPITRTTFTDEVTKKTTQKLDATAFPSFKIVAPDGFDIFGITGEGNDDLAKLTKDSRTVPSVMPQWNQSDFTVKIICKSNVPEKMKHSFTYHFIDGSDGKTDLGKVQVDGESGDDADLTALSQLIMQLQQKGYRSESPIKGFVFSDNDPATKDITVKMNHQIKRDVKTETGTVTIQFFDDSGKKIKDDEVHNLRKVTTTETDLVTNQQVGKPTVVGSLDFDSDTDLGSGMILNYDGDNQTLKERDGKIVTKLPSFTLTDGENETIKLQESHQDQEQVQHFVFTFKDLDQGDTQVYRGGHKTDELNSFSLSLDGKNGDVLRFGGKIPQWILEDFVYANDANTNLNSLQYTINQSVTDPSNNPTHNIVINLKHIVRTGDSSEYFLRHVTVNVPTQDHSTDMVQFIQGHVNTTFDTSVDEKLDPEHFWKKATLSNDLTLPGEDKAGELIDVSYQKDGDYAYNYVFPVIDGYDRVDKVNDVAIGKKGDDITDKLKQMSTGDQGLYGIWNVVPDVTINYKKNAKPTKQVTKKINFVDQYSDKVVGTQNVTGNQWSEQNVKLNAPKGFHLADSTQENYHVVLDADGDINIKVIADYDPNHIFNKEIHYVDSNGKVISVQKFSGKINTTAGIKLQVPEHYHLVSGVENTLKVTFTNDDAVNVPVERDQTDPEMTTQVINFVNANGGTVGEQRINGEVGKTQTVKLNIPAGYRLVNGQQASLSIIFKQGSEPIEIKVEPASKPNDKVTQTIIFVTKDGKNVGKQTVTGNKGAKATVKLNIPSGYELADNTKTSIDITFDDQKPMVQVVVVPSVKTVDQEIDFVDENGKIVGRQTVTGETGVKQNVKLNVPTGYKVDNDDISITFNKNATPIQVKVTDATPVINKHIVFVTDDGKAIGNQGVSGKQGTTGEIKLDVPDGYKLPDGGSSTIKITFDDKDQNVKVVVVPTTPEMVERDIQFVDENGNSVATQKTTGEANKKQNVKLNIPAGYKLSNDQNNTIEVTYDQSLPVRVMVVKQAKTLNKQIRFIDDSGKVVGTQQVTGDEGSTIDVKFNIPDGYQQLDVHNGISLKLTDETPFDVRVTKVESSEVKVTKTINFVDRATGQAINSMTITKDQGTVESVNLISPKGYHLVDSALSKINLNFDKNDSMNILVAKDETHHNDQPQTVVKTIEFIDQNGSVIGKQFVSGLDGTSQAIELNIPAGYELVDHNGGQLTVRFDVNGNNIEIVNVKKVVDNPQPNTANTNTQNVVTDTTDTNKHSLAQKTNNTVKPVVVANSSNVLTNGDQRDNVSLAPNQSAKDGHSQLTDDRSRPTLPQTGSTNVTGLVALGLSTLSLGMILGLKSKKEL